MDPELKAHPDEMRAEIRAVDAKIDGVDAGLRAEIRALDAKVDAQGRDLRQGMADIMGRPDAGFAARKEDEDTALSEIEDLKGRVRSC